jgi:diguanylate cyclase (GGDEF)-like protein
VIEPAPSWPSTRTVEEYVRTQTLNAVFKQAAFGPLFSLIAAALVAIGVWRVTSHGRVVVWISAIAMVSFARMALLFAYRRTEPSEQLSKWEQAFLCSLFGVSLVWGVGAVFVLPSSVTHEVLIYFFLAGIAGSTVASYSAHPTACVLALTSLVLPLTIWFAWHDVIELRVMAVGGAMYLIAAIRATLSYGEFWRRSFRLSWELRQAHDKADQLARTDELTGVNNRRAFVDLGTQALEHARRYNRPLALVMFDIDRFKAINDTLGHSAGDRVLQAIGTELRRVVRVPDIAGRLGGEEFAVLLPETQDSKALAFAERLREDLAALVVPYENATIRFTCSFGVAVLTDDITVLDTLLDRGDGAMYRAKSAGRNRVATAQVTQHPLTA